MKDILKKIGKFILWVVLTGAFFAFLCPGIKLNFDVTWGSSIAIAILPSMLLGGLFTRETLKED